MSGFTPVGTQPQQQPKRSGFTPAGGSGFAPVQPEQPKPRGPLQWGKYPAGALPTPSAAGEKLFPTIDRLADKYGVPRSVMHAAASIESLWTPDPTHAGSQSGAYGPAQIEASVVSPKFDRSNPEDAFGYMAQTLSANHKHFGDWGLAAAAYNAGSGAIDSWLKQSGNLDDLNKIANSFSPGTTNDPLSYAVRVNHALTGEQAQMAHRQIETRNHAVTQDRLGISQKLLYQRGQEEHGNQTRLASLAMNFVMPGAEAGIESIQSPLVQGPLQALGAYGELITAASPLIGAAAGRDPNVPHLPTPSGPMTVTQYEKKYGTQARQELQAWEAGKHHDPKILAAYHDVITAALHGPQALATAEERYSIGSPGFMAATGHGKVDPRAQVALRMALDLFGANPAKLVAPLQWLSHVMREVPAVDRAMVMAGTLGAKVTMSKPVRFLQQQFNPYAVLRQGAARVGAEPEAVQVAGRKMSTANHVASVNADKLRRAVYADLTSEQEEEVGRRSQTLIKGQDVQPHNLNVPEPKKGPSLTDRANAERFWRMGMDDKLIARKMGDAHTMIDPWTYLNLYGPDVWKGKELSEPEQEFLAEVGRTRPGGKGTLSERAPGKTRDPMTGEPLYEFYDQAKASGKLSPKFSFADNFEQHMVSRGQQVILEDALTELRDAGMGKALTYSTEASAFLGKKTEGGAIIGTGEKGAKKAETVGARIDYYNATQLTKKQLGVSDDEWKAVMRSNPVAAARAVRAHEATTKLAEKAVQPAQKAATKLETGLAARAGVAKAKAVDAAGEAAKVASGVAREAQAASSAAASAKVGWHIAQAFYGEGSPLAKKSALLFNKAFTANIQRPEALRFAEALKANLKEEAGTAFAAMQAKAQEGGFKIGAEMKGLAPSVPSMSKWFGYEPEAAQFIMRQGATPGEARDVARVWRGIINFYRMGVVYGPIRHPFINLPLQFLFRAGTPANLLRAYLGKTGPEWEERLKGLVGMHEMVTQPTFGGSAHMAFDMPLRNVGKEAADKLGPDVPHGAKAMAAMGATANAAISRAWRAQANFVFNWAEKNMAVSHFRQLVEGGMDEKLAANKIADWYWHSQNVNRHGFEGLLNNGLLFYPWLKAIIPAAMQAMVTHPQYVWAPYSRAQDWNRANGDPRWQQESEGTVYLGNRNGQDEYMSWPGPQKYLDQFLSVAAPSSPGLQGRLQKVENLAEGELVPPGGTAVGLITTAASKPTEPGPPNFNIMWDKAAPEDVQLQQLTMAAINQMPFGQAIVKTLQGAQQLKGNAQTTALSALSLNPYSRLSPKLEKKQHEIFNDYINGFKVPTPEGSVYMPGQQHIANQIYQVKIGPGTSAYKNVKIHALNDRISELYWQMRMKAQLLDPSLSVSDKDTIRKQANEKIFAIRKERFWLQKTASFMEAQQRAGTQSPGPQPTATPASGFVPIQQ